MVNSTEIVEINAKARIHSERRYMTFKRDVTTDGVREVVETQVYCLEDESPKIELFQLLREFKELRTAMSWTTGAALFRNWRLLLTGSADAIDAWDDEVASATGQSIATFVATQDLFMKAMLKPLKYDSQLDYLRGLKKPSNKRVAEFLKTLRFLNKLSASFPDANGATGLDDAEFKRCFFLAMPKSWQTNFMNAGNKYSSSTIEAIETYMEGQEELDPPSRPASNKSNNGSSSNSTNVANNNNNNNNNNNENSNRNRRNRNRRRNGSGNRNGGNNRNGNGSNANSNNGGNGGNTGNRRIRPEDPCPLPGHGNHTWYRCFNNAHGAHGDNSRRPANAGGNGNGQAAESNSTEQEAEQHFLDALGYCPDINTFEFDQAVDEMEAESFFVTLDDDASSDASDDESLPELEERNEFYDGATSEDESEDELDTTTDDAKPFGIDSAPDSVDWCAELAWMFAQAKTTQGDAGTVRSGPIGLSEGAFESFKTEAVLDGGVDNVVTRSTVPPLVPTTLSHAASINGARSLKPFKTLIDHGASHSIIQKRVLPASVRVSTAKDIAFNTTAGSFKTSTFVECQDFRLPEFNRNRKVHQVKLFVFEAPKVQYDVILGRDFLNSVGIDVKSSSLTCEWCGDEIPFKPPSYMGNVAAHAALLNIEPFESAEAEAESHAVTFTATKSTVADIDEVVRSQTHLSESQRAQLHELLSKHKELFNGKLGCYPHRKFKIELKPGSVPYHCKRPYPVPASLAPIVKGELDRQVETGVLARVYESEWGMPMLCIPKKDGAIRTVDDMRELNKCVQRRVYPLPRLLDMIRRHHGWKFITVLDLTLCYYTYMLEEESSWYCVLVTPFGKYRRLRLSMGLAQSPDWAQGALEEVFEQEIRDFVEAYIDDVAAFSATWEEHLMHLEIVLDKLERNGYTVNPAKCKWGVAEVEWMGHLVTTDGLKPWPKKVEGILNIAPPKTLTQLRAFIGCVNFYRDFWEKRAHVMAPLTALTKVPKKEFLKHWTPECDAAFKATKAMVAKDILLAIPDPNKPFVIETDASDKQLGAVGYQDGRPVFIWSRKLNSAQQKYPTPDKEAVSIVEVLNAFRPMLYGADLEVRTDHINITRTNIQSHRLLKWRLMMEEFAPRIVYKPGADNVVADGLSRLPLLPREEQGDPASGSDEPPDLMEQLNEVLLYYPEAIDAFPLEFALLSEAQQQDETVQQKLQAGDYITTNFGEHQLVTKLVDGERKIVVPEAIHEATIRWYHVVLGHAGQERLSKSLRNHLHFPGLSAKVKSFVETCDECQRYKKNNRGYGLLPVRDDYPAPFEEVALDHVGPWTIEVPEFGKLKFEAMTIVDTASTLLEVFRVESTSAEHSALVFENQWLARYPRPTRCVYDAGGAFIGVAFQLALNRNGIQGVPITIKNPQSNAIVERCHSTIGDMLRSYQSANVPDNVDTAFEVIDTAIASSQRAIRTAVHKSFGVSPGSIIFQRDMLLNVPLAIDLDHLNNRRFAIAVSNNNIENRRRRYKNYTIGDEVLILAPAPTKMGARAIGPYTIVQVHVNGTITIQRRPGVFERINIRRVKPYNRR